MYALLFAYVAVTAAYQFVSSAAATSELLGLRERVKEPFELDSDTGAVTSTTKSARRAGLRVGDLIESINGVPYRGVAQLQAVEWHARAGDPIRLNVRRPGGTQVALRMNLELHPRRIGSGEAAFLIFIQVVVPLFCLVIG